DFSRRFQMLSPCRAVSLLGLPSVAVTCGATGDGLPVAVQVVARPFHDEEALAVAGLLYEALGRG
ncbi:MAG: amidase family protein, partial [Gaiellales bacterium]